MKEKIRNLSSAICKLGGISVLLTLVVMVTGWLLFANYNGLVLSFELLGYDQMPIAENRLFGWLFEVLMVADATLCDLFAGAVVLLMTLSIAFAVHLFDKSIVYMGDMSRYKKTGDNDSATVVMHRFIYEVAPWLILSLFLSTIITLWDIELFNYRVAAGIMGYEGRQAALSLKESSLLSQQYADRVSMNVAAVSQWGYAGVLVFMAVLLDYVFKCFLTRCFLIFNAFAEFFPEKKRQDSGQAVTVQTGGIDADPAESTAEKENTQYIHQENTAGNVQTAHRASDDTVGDQESPENTLFSCSGFDANEEVEVIGGNGMRVRRSTALEDRERFYLDGEGRVWDKNYYEELNNA